MHSLLKRPEESKFKEMPIRLRRSAQNIIAIRKLYARLTWSVNLLSTNRDKLYYCQTRQYQQTI